MPLDLASPDAFVVCLVNGLLTCSKQAGIRLEFRTVASVLEDHVDETAA